VSGDRHTIRAGAVLVLALAIGLAPLGSAQEASAEVQVEPVPTVQEQVMLRGRSRSLLHPSEPLKLGGLEDEGNDMRSGTTALQRGNTKTAGVDGDENYERAIAMVEGRALYTSPPKRVSGTNASAGNTDAKATAKKQRKPRSNEDAPRPSDNMPWALGGLAAAALCIFGWLFVRNRA